MGARRFRFGGNLSLSLSFELDQGLAATKAARQHGAFGDQIFMQTIRPDNTDPIPLRNSPPRMGTIMIRFVGLLVAGGGGAGAGLEPLMLGELCANSIAMVSGSVTYRPAIAASSE